METLETYLHKPNILALFPEALSADVEAIFADETGFVGADAAVDCEISNQHIVSSKVIKATLAKMTGGFESLNYGLWRLRSEKIAILGAKHEMKHTKTARLCRMCEGASTRLTRETLLRFKVGGVTASICQRFRIVDLEEFRLQHFIRGSNRA